LGDHTKEQRRQCSIWPRRIGGVALQSCNQTGVATDRLQRQDLAKLATAKLDLAQANNEARRDWDARGQICPTKPFQI